MAKIKGTAVSASLTYLKERLGADGFAQVLSEVSPEAKASLGGTILPSGWYPFAHLIELTKKAEPKVSRGAKPLSWEMGRYSAESGVKTVYKIFFRVADVGFILKRASAIFSNYYDSGAMKVEREEKGDATLVIMGFDEPSNYFCERVLGWMERLLELTGSKDIRVSHPKCCSRGDDRCEYRGHWS